VTWHGDGTMNGRSDEPGAASSEFPEDPVVIRVALPAVDGNPGRELQWRVPLASLRRYLAIGAAFAVAASVLLGTWVFLAARAAGVGGMEDRMALLEEERQQVRELAATLEAAEESYQRLRELFLPAGGEAGPLWLPPAGIGPAAGTGGARGGAPQGDENGSEAPELWPLTERGFLTRGLVAAGEGVAEGATHPGIDIAVPSGSYFRAVGRGQVVERGEDPVYGLFVVVEHQGGYRSLYAHASVISAEPGRSVAAGEVLGLTGSSGRSTAPHLHLEITLHGDQVDPLTLLRRP
jgi:murein DD-endopeptidase MepM/ murein hydrolase activator NlpD